ncbi:hypothetical protein L915_21059 [Phytophthora nicotianae]|uniref:Uncharacterized protein n=2 Tax=Phytophthora nicotianae TaxID=4792 RepID=V9DXK4_PHYNI|nr:hypothetical protein F443_21653 [Phytophthora nicotianae P1569]ETK71745.1 hypothetical protein L915_21059 [Phytophthora nicotianae]
MVGADGAKVSNSIDGLAICPEAAHKMRYRLLVCSSQASREASSIKRAWQGKIMTYLETDHASFSEYSDHNTFVATSPRRKKPTPSRMTYYRELAENHL